jgi:hypothetical protein
METAADQKMKNCLFSGEETVYNLFNIPLNYWKPEIEQGRKNAV